MSPHINYSILCRVHRQTEVGAERLDLEARRCSGVSLRRRRPRGPPTEFILGGLNDHALAPHFPDHWLRHLVQDTEGQLHTERQHRGSKDAGTHAECKPVLVRRQHGNVEEGLDDIPADEVIAQLALRLVARQAIVHEGTVVHCAVFFAEPSAGRRPLR